MKESLSHERKSIKSKKKQHENNKIYSHIHWKIKEKNEKEVKQLKIPYHHQHTSGLRDPALSNA